MTQLEKLKSLLENPEVSDVVIQFYLDDAKDIICELRNTIDVEPQYLNIQLKIAVELFSKRGAEGEVSHSENGIGRSYESADISPSLLSRITPCAKTPFSGKRMI